VTEFLISRYGHRAEFFNGVAPPTLQKIDLGLRAKGHPTPMIGRHARVTAVPSATTLIQVFENKTKKRLALAGEARLELATPGFGDR
jgi:hypothetical protein